MSQTPDEQSNALSLESFNQWQDIWLNLATEAQKNLEKAFSDSVSSPIPLETTIFDPEVVTSVFAKTFQALSENPDKLIEIQKSHLDHIHTLWQTILSQTGEPLSFSVKDKRFQNPLWKENHLFSTLQTIYLMNAKFLKDTMASIEGLDSKTRHKLNFYTQHLIDALSPSNFPFTNPDVIQETIDSNGENLIRGFNNFLRDMTEESAQIRMITPDAFQLGENIAATKGAVIFENELFQLIQYAPTTEKVMNAPLLIIPPWINKYYIFDLRPEHSFIKWAVDSGMTVFIISWVNPDERHAKKTLTDYVLEGAKTAVDQVLSHCKVDKLNTIGYCTGGIILNSLIAYLTVKKINPIQSATIIATPIDFREAGDLLVYVCEQQLEKLERIVSKKGYLDGKAMVNAFNLLRANDLIWSFYINNYLLGREPLPFDMLQWNCDSLRMPAKMHLYFLRKMFLENKFIQPGGIAIDKTKIDLTKIETPMFVMAAIDDHIAPWRSVYPLTQYAKNVQKFVLGASGHVAGVFNHPDKNKYHYWMNSTYSESPDSWLHYSEKHAGSWWPEWRNWIEQFSNGYGKSRKISQKNILEPAPGKYALTMSD